MHESSKWAGFNVSFQHLVNCKKYWTPKRRCGCLHEAFRSRRTDRCTDVVTDNPKRKTPADAQSSLCSKTIVDSLKVTWKEPGQRSPFAPVPLWVPGQMPLLPRWSRRLCSSTLWGHKNQQYKMFLDSQTVFYTKLETHKKIHTHVASICMNFWTTLYIEIITI